MKMVFFHDLVFIKVISVYLILIFLLVSCFEEIRCFSLGNSFKRLLTVRASSHFGSLVHGVHRLEVRVALKSDVSLEVCVFSDTRRFQLLMQSRG